MTKRKLTTKNRFKAGCSARSESSGHEPLALAEAFHLIDNLTPFAAFSVEGSCGIRVNDYVPLICSTLHDGSSFPTGLEKDCLLSPAQRRFEEDPHTNQLLDRLPIVLAGRDSRYYYDLNRAPKQATSRRIFGQDVWRNEQHPDPHQALACHQRFYQLAGALIEQMMHQYGFCLVLDFHSYNSSKISRRTPLFNLGTSGIDTRLHRSLLDKFLNELATIQLPGHTTSVAENDVFQGRGYFVSWIRKTYPKALAICLEVKKIYCDERSGDLYPEIFTPLQAGLSQAIGNLLTACHESNPPYPGQQTVNL